MPEDLYIFVDESGSCARGEYYTVAACWCTSNSHNPNNIARKTVDRVKDSINAQLRDFELSELKATDIPNTVLNENVSEIQNHAYDDSTISQSHPAWNDSLPIRYSIRHYHPDLCLEVIDSGVSNPSDSAQKLQSLGLIGVLQPLVHGELLSDAAFDEVNVVLDSDVWKNASQEVDGLFSDTEFVNHEPQFTTGDSKKLPGLQIADIGAFSWARHARKGDLEKAVQWLDQLRFAAKFSEEDTLPYSPHRSGR